MKKTVYILISIITALAVCGCSASVCHTQDAEIADGGSHDSFSTIAEIHIDISQEPVDEYTMAAVSANWTGGDMLGLPAVIKIRGNSAKKSAKKSYNIKFEENQEFMGMYPGRKWALVSNSFDKSLLRSAVGFTYAERLGLDYVPETRLCELWINGVCMGIYTAVESVEAGEGRVEIDPDGGDFLLERNLTRVEDDKTYLLSSAGLRFEFNEPETPDQEQLDQCYDLLMQAETAIMTSDYQEYSKYIDVGSFVNFYIFSEVIKDVDLGEYSTRYYFRDGILHIGPPWDLDLTQGNVSTSKEEFKYVEYNNMNGTGDKSGDSTTDLWADTRDYYFWLCDDPWFCSLVQSRWQTLRPVTENLATENQLGISLIDQYLEAHLSSLESNFAADGAGWDITLTEDNSEYQEPAAEYIANVEMLRSWLQKRTAYLDTAFGANLLKIPGQNN